MTLSEPDRAFVEQARNRDQRTSRTILVLAIAVALLAAAGAMLGYGYISERSKRTSNRRAIEALQKSQQAHDVELEDVKRRQMLLVQQLEANHITPDPEALLPATTTTVPSGRGKSAPATTVTTAARTPSTTTTAPAPSTTTTTAPPPSPTTTSQICGVLGNRRPMRQRRTMIIAATNGTVQTLRLVCIFECVAALAGLVWGLSSIYRHRPNMPRNTYVAVSAAIAAFAACLMSIMFTELGRFIAADKVTWRLPWNLGAAGLVIAAILLFSRSGFSPPIRPLPGVTRNPPMLVAATLLVLFVSTSIIIVAFQQAHTASVIDQVQVQILDANHNHQRTQRILCDEEAKLRMVPSPDCAHVGP